METGLPGSTARLGILGGTFDPLHVAHLAVAAAAATALDLHKVLFVVANRPWQKTRHGEVTPATSRLAMVNAALAGDPRFEASDIEISRGGDSFTADPLAEVAAANPGSELFLIIGSDLLTELHTWERPDQVRDLAHLAIVRRPGSIGDRPPDRWRYTEIESPPVDLSSSELRAAIAAGRSVEFLVPAGALQVIDEQGLYRSSLGGS